MFNQLDLYEDPPECIDEPKPIDHQRLAKERQFRCENLREGNMQAFNIEFEFSIRKGLKNNFKID